MGKQPSSLTQVDVLETIQIAAAELQP